MRREVTWDVALLRKYGIYGLWLVGGFIGLLVEVRVLGSESGIGMALGVGAGAALAWALTPSTP